jgi:hypothetical protein
MGGFMRIERHNAKGLQRAIRLCGLKLGLRARQAGLKQNQSNIAIFCFSGTKHNPYRLSVQVDRSRLTFRINGTVEF